MSGMKKKIIALIVCLAVLGLLILAYVLAQNKKEADLAEEAANAAETPQTVFTLVSKDSADLTKIVLTGEDYTITLNLNEDGQWVCAEMPELPIKQSNVKTIAGYLASLTSANIVTFGAEDVSQYGLSPAKNTVTGYFSDGEMSVFELGYETPAKDYVYLRQPGSNDVYMVSSYVGGVLTRGFGELADASIPAFEVINARYIYFFNGGVPLEGEYIEQAQSDIPNAISSNIILSSPIAGKSAYLENIDSMVVANLSAISLTKIHELTQSQPNSFYGFDAPTLRVAFSGITTDATTGAENGEFSFDVTIGGSASETEYYAKKDGVPCVYLVEKSALTELLAVNTYKLLEKFINIQYIVNVDKINITFGETKYDIAVNNYKSSTGDGTSEYDEIAPVINGVTVESDAFRSFYQLCVGLAVDSIIELTPTGSPAFTISYTLADGTVSATEYYEYDANFYAAISPGEEVSHFAIRKMFIDNLMLSLNNLIS
ncbi:hypothetical protein FACS189490_13400 [Clostridia bacterium]|nr:hypothetical protein FACS189490_13400 [Clostridia bacterium]